MGLGPAAFRRAFTLIELILVMATLSLALSVAAPSLARFFRGRGLEAEARRLVGLTRYAQSRAVSEGVPMLLWIDERRGAYGLEAESSYLQLDPKAVEFVLPETLQIQVEQPVLAPVLSRWRGANQIGGNLPTLRFSPDGFISETSPEYLLLRQRREGEQQELWIGRSRNRLNYEIQTNPPPFWRR